MIVFLLPQVMGYASEATDGLPFSDGMEVTVPTLVTLAMVKEHLVRAPS